MSLFDPGLPPTPSGRPALVRAIGRGDLMASVINCVVGSSIFGMPAVLAALTGEWSPAVYAAAGIGILAIVLCHAEVASRFTEGGGPYLYAREAFGPFVGVQAGWLSFCTRATSMGANLNVFADYLAQILPRAGEGPGRIVTMSAVTAIVAVINVAGVRAGARTVDAFVVAKLLPLVLLVVLGLPRLSSATLASQHVESPDWTQAVLLLVTAYGGFEAALIPAGEVRNPRGDSAFALLAGMAVVASVYLLVQLTVVGVLPHAAQAKAPVAAAFDVLLGRPGVALASLAAMVSTYGWTVGSTLNSPRIFYSMGERGELPKLFAHVHPRYRTPDVAILFYAGGGLAFAASGGFAANATLSAIVRCVTYGLVAVALLVFRGRDAAPAGFRTPLASVVAPVAIAFCLWLLVTRTFTQAWILLALMAFGTVLWLIPAWRRRSRAAF